jgi:hypothetical protein
MNRYPPLSGRAAASLAVLTKAAAGTGNFVTAERLSECVSSAARCKCCIVEESQFESAADFLPWLEENGVVFVLGVHAFRAGRLLCDGAVPYGIVLGGTDVNVDMQSASSRREVCVAALLQARFVVAFSKEMVQSLTDALSACALSASLLQSLLRKVSVIHQSVSIPQRSLGDATAPPSIHAYLGLDPAINVILLPAALRPIKDPLFLLDALCLHSASCTVEPATRFCLLIVGPSLDESTLSCVQEACALHPQVCRYSGLQPRQVVLHWMTSSFCVANTSHSEGMSGTILEAMAVGCPVLARCNAGNCGLVKHRVNGFVFSSAPEAVRRSLPSMHFCNNRLRYSCALSWPRGPRCGRRYAARRLRASPAATAESQKRWHSIVCCANTMYASLLQAPLERRRCRRCLRGGDRDCFYSGRRSFQHVAVITHTVLITLGAFLLNKQCCFCHCH